MIVLAVAAAGALGTLARFGVDTAVKQRWPGRPRLPVLVINVTGSLLLGLVVGLVSAHGASEGLRTVAGTGFCASYTTFSTATYETLGLVRQRRWRAAAAHALTTLVASTLAAGLGLALSIG